MKRLIIACLFFAVSFSINAQDIEFRYILEPDGLSVMTTTQDVFSFSAKPLEYALQFEESSVEVQNLGYTLHIYFAVDDRKLYVPKGGKLLIKTTKDEVLNLEDCGTDYFIGYNSESGNYKIMERQYRYYDTSFKRNRYKVHGKYVISEDELRTLMTDGVAKIRIETTGEPIQCEYKPSKTNKTASVIQKLYNVLIRNIDLYYGL